MNNILFTVPFQATTTTVIHTTTKDSTHLHLMRHSVFALPLNSFPNIEALEKDVEKSLALLKIATRNAPKSKSSITKAWNEGACQYP